LIHRSSGTGSVIYLPAYHNNVLNALSLTGGLPGLDAANEIVIQRGAMETTPQQEGSEPYVSDGVLVIPDPPAGVDNPDNIVTDKIVRIPLRLAPGQPLPFRPQDVILHDGDIVLIEARDTDVFYTGGLLPSGEYPLPRDYDLDVVEAVSQVGGPMVNGGINSNNLTGALVAPGIGSPSPRLVTVLRPMPAGGRLPIIVDLHRALTDPSENLLVVPGDVLILQESKKQALARYVTEIFNLTIFTEIFSRGSATGTAVMSAP
jgi:hypothetical protein